MKTKKIFVVATYLWLILLQTFMFMSKSGMNFLFALGLALLMLWYVTLIAYLVVSAIEWIIDHMIG